MPIPSHVCAYRDQLLPVVSHDPDHALRPYHRQRLYRIIEQTAPNVNGHLAYITAAKVLPYWTASMPHDQEPHAILEITRAYLDSTITKEMGFQRWYRAEQRFGVDVIANSRYFESVPYPAIWAVQAVLYAFLETHQPHPFLTYTLTERETDADIDPWSADVAQLASQAIAGGYGNQRLIWSYGDDGGRGG
jgi:hypothetical protein